MSDDFRDALSAFVVGGVRFLVVGAHALAVHGVPRVTGDLDLWIGPSDENAERTWRALKDFGAPLESLGIRPADFRTPDQVVQLGLPPYRLDVLTSVSGVSFEDAWRDRIAGTLFGVEVAFLGRDAFVRNKRATGRARDRDDLRALGELGPDAE